MTDHDTRDDPRREMEEFANAPAQRNQPTRGHALVRPTSAIDRPPIGAQKLDKYRDKNLIRQELKETAAMAGKDWFYRFPVKTKDGGQDWIEGPSIKLANEVARAWGNNATEVREVDVGDAWVFYARFTDFETGFQMERAYRQYKSQRSMKVKDWERQEAIAYQIGQSKAIRNVIVNSLQIFADFAFEEARGSLVDKIGKNLEDWRARAIEGIARMPGDVELLRVERVIGRSAKDWLAADIARVVAMMQAIADGMATADETFPLVVEKPTEASTPATESGSAAAAESGTQGERESPPQDKADEAGAKTEQQPATAKPKTKAEPPKNTPKTIDEYMEFVRGHAAAADDGDQLRAWFASDGQRRLRNACQMAAEQTNEARKIVEDRVKELRS
jgi:hypothetical protein